MAEQTEDGLSALRALIKSELIDLNTSISAEVVSYSGGLASVRPLASKRFADGDILPFPVIHSVPVRWPVFSGGTCGVRGPIKAGDKCHLVFAQQAADNSDDMRRHDLTDAYALMMDNSAAGQGGNESDMVVYNGPAYIRFGAGGDVEIVAPGGLKFTTPATVNTGTFTVQGLFTFLAGIFGIGGGSASSITADINLVGALTSNGKNITDTHTHSGVTVGAGVSGGVS